MAKVEAQTIFSRAQRMKARGDSNESPQPTPQDHKESGENQKIKGRGGKEMTVDYYFYEGELYKTTMEEGERPRTFIFKEWRWEQIGSFLPWEGCQLITPERVQLYQMALLGDAEVQGSC